MLKKTFFQIHWFLGISAGLILALMGITGAIYSYEQPIQKWLSPESFTVKVEQSPKLNPAQIFQHFQQSDPSIKINSITIAQDPSTSTTINIEKEGARKGFNMMVNPYTAEVLPDVTGREFFMFVQKLHRNLTFGPVGAQITGACTLILIFFVLSGLYLRWPKRHSIKQWLTVNSQLTGRNFLWNLHAVVGTWVIIFYLILAITGLTWSYSWWRQGLSNVLGVEQQPKAAMLAGNQPENKSQEPSHSNKGKQPKIALSPDKIEWALNQTWVGFNAQMNRKYSTLTINIPKKANGEVDVTFVDAIPQHERARNKATYNYHEQKIQNLELYESKQLNEKIMSSMLPVHRGSFFGPVYQFLAMLASLCMPLFFVTGWMLYLKRRKQKQLTQAARQSLVPVSLDTHTQPWLITYASQTGTSEQIAWNTAASLQQAQQSVQVKPVQQLTKQDLLDNQQILFIVSTYGTGEAPDLALNFVKSFFNQKIDLSHLNYAVLALGSTDYPETYCQFGHELDQWLRQNDAHALFPILKVNNANAADIQTWKTTLATQTNLTLQTVSIEKTFETCTLIKREELNPNSLGAPAFNIELCPQHEITWQAGDIAEIQPGNNDERIEKFLQQHQIDAHTLIPSLGISIEQALWDKNLQTHITPFSTLEQLLQQLPTLATREYSIASIPSERILRLVVRQQKKNGELGLGSGWLTQHVKIENPISLHIRSNESFHLIDDDRPIICIGNGTGIAGLLSLLQMRQNLHHHKNWLIFGERQCKHDYFFQDIIETWKNTGLLQKLDLAFSRDQEEKVYVHHKLHEQAQELKQWISNGAVIYVCGSIHGMAKDVDQTLIALLGEEQVDQLRVQGRYRRDVY